MTLTTLTYLLISALVYLFSNGYSEPTQVAEKVYLHIDRSIYNSGDDIWFKAYVIDALSNKPSSKTYNLHVEIISPDAKIIQSRILRIDNGLGNGDFSLSDSIPSGRYIIRAYTNFMRNFNEEFFFKKEIVVINPFDEGNGLNDSVKYIENRLFINFFPEGGSLVDNVSSIIAFKATNALGKGCDVTGRVFSTTGELITTFKSSHQGMGIFDLKPVQGINYYSIVKGEDGIEYRAPIPNSFKAGVTIHTLVLQDNKLLIKVQTNNLTLPLIIDKEMQFTFSSRNLFTKTLRFKLDTLVNNFIVPLIDFPEGIIKVTLSNPNELPLCERLIFLKKSKNVSIDLAPDKPQYKTREPVRINISLSGDTSSFRNAYLSLSASEKISTKDSLVFGTSIVSWFLLESDVHGPIEDPSYYFDISNENRFQDLDLLLLTQGWRDFRWKYDKTNSYRHEIGFSISGRVKKGNGKKQFEGARINIGVLAEKASNFLTATSDSSGAFCIDGIGIIGKAKIVASVMDKKGRPGGWISLDSITYSPPDVFMITNEKIALLPVEYSELKQEALDQNTIRKKYKLNDTISINEVYVTAKKRETGIESKLISSRVQYGKPDKELILTPAMETYPDLLRVLDGRMAGVEIHKRQGAVTIRGQVPLVLLDGVPTGMSVLSDTPPNMVDRIDILYWSSPFGSRGANGIINIITKTGDYNYKALSMDYSKSTTLKGFDVPRVFYSPAYNTTNSAGLLPDSRKTVFWEPNILISNGASFSKRFYNSDKNTTIELIVEGLTDNGIPLTARRTYEVK